MTEAGTEPYGSCLATHRMVTEAGTESYGSCLATHRMVTEAGTEPYGSCLATHRMVTEAAGLGFEPRYMDPESMVLPLDDPAMLLIGASAEEADI